MFKPTYLYIKTHNITGLKYFGKTTKPDPHKYKGSGLYWLKHLKIHGNNVTTEIVGYYTDKKDCFEAADKFSKENDIVESNEWANLVPESGEFTFENLPAEKLFDITSTAGKIGGKRTYELKRGIFNQDFIDNPKTKLMRKEVGKINGKRLGNDNRRLMRGLFNPKFDDLRKKWAKNASKSRKVNSTKIGNDNVLLQRGWYNPEYKEKNKQRIVDAARKMGKEAGIKSKGSKWYNDGIANYRYHLDKQQIKPFTDFIADNPQFKAGRIKNKINQ